MDKFLSKVNEFTKGLIRRKEHTKPEKGLTLQKVLAEFFQIYLLYIYNEGQSFYKKSSTAQKGHQLIFSPDWSYLTCEIFCQVV